MEVNKICITGQQLNMLFFTSFYIFMKQLNLTEESIHVRGAWYNI